MILPLIVTELVELDGAGADGGVFDVAVVGLLAFPPPPQAAKPMANIERIAIFLLGTVGSSIRARHRERAWMRPKQLECH